MATSPTPLGSGCGGGQPNRTPLGGVFGGETNTHETAPVGSRWRCADEDKDGGGFDEVVIMMLMLAVEGDKMGGGGGVDVRRLRRDGEMKMKVVI
ncbi:hypothetical protein Tco_0035424 [Tanacetum coccineum]